MMCNHLSDLSDDWVAEKSKCISLSEKQRVSQIQGLFRSKLKSLNQYFTPKSSQIFLFSKVLREARKFS